MYREAISLRPDTSGTSHWHLHFNNAVHVPQLGHLPKHCASAAVAGLREFNRSPYRFVIEMMPCNDVFNSDILEDHRVVFGTYALHKDLVAGHILAFLAQNGSQCHTSFTNIHQCHLFASRGEVGCWALPCGFQPS